MEKIINLDEIIILPIKDYNDYVEKIKKEILDDYKSKIRFYTYKKTDENKTVYIKDSIINFTAINGEEEYELTYGNFLTILYTFKIINYVYNKSEDYKDIINYYTEFLYDPSEIDNINQYYDDIYNHLIDFKDIKDLLFNNLSEITALSSKFVSGTVSLYSICKMYANDEDFRTALNYNVDDLLDDFPKMIRAIKKNMNVITELLKEIDSEYKYLILSNSGINFKQASQIFNVVGPKPDIFGNIHPIAITSNYLNGLSNVAEYFINADGARKALVTNYSAVKDSGYLTRILSILCVDNKLLDVKRCNTKIENLPPIYIKNKYRLSQYKNRYYWNEEINDYELVGDNESLIGKTIKVASPATCSCKNGTCRTCYGRLSKTNKENIGLIAVLLLTEKLTQMLLSTKHLLEANAQEIEWSEDINKAFDISSNKLYLSEIDLKDIIVSDIDVRNGEITKLTIEGNEVELPVSIFLNEEVYKLEQIDVDTEEYSIIDDAEEEVSKINRFLFTFSLKNKELSDPLNKVIDLINTNNVKERDISGNINEFLDRLDEANIKLSSEHLEILISELVYMDNKERFATEINPSYEMVKASEKVLKGPVTKSILFERLKEQLLNPETYKKPAEDSMLDFLL